MAGFGMRSTSTYHLSSPSSSLPMPSVCLVGQSFPSATWPMHLWGHAWRTCLPPFPSLEPHTGQFRFWLVGFVICVWGGTGWLVDGALQTSHCLPPSSPSCLCSTCCLPSLLLPPTQPCLACILPCTYYPFCLSLSAHTPMPSSACCLHTCLPCTCLPVPTFCLLCACQPCHHTSSPVLPACLATTPAYTTTCPLPVPALAMPHCHHLHHLPLPTIPHSPSYLPCHLPALPSPACLPCLPAPILPTTCHLFTYFCLLYAVLSLPTAFLYTCRAHTLPCLCTPALLPLHAPFSPRLHSPTAPALYSSPLLPTLPHLLHMC